MLHQSARFGGNSSRSEGARIRISFGGKGATSIAMVAATAAMLPVMAASVDYLEQDDIKSDPCRNNVENRLRLWLQQLIKRLAQPLPVAATIHNVEIIRTAYCDGSSPTQRGSTLSSKGSANSTADEVERIDTAPTREEAIEMMLGSPDSPNTIEDIRAEGLKRREASGCPFCASMLERPCGALYEEWDDCVNSMKGTSAGEDPKASNSFVMVCAVFTRAMMQCMQEHIDAYPEMKPSSESSNERDSENRMKGINHTDNERTTTEGQQSQDETKISESA